MIACSAGHIEIVKLLIEKGANVRVTNNNGQTPLHYAASRNRLDVAQVLLEANSEVNPRDNMGSTPMHRAASRGHIDMVKLLLSSKWINLDAVDCVGNTPLQVFRCHNRCVSY